MSRLEYNSHSMSWPAGTGPGLYKQIDVLGAGKLIELYFRDCICIENGCSSSILASNSMYFSSMVFHTVHCFTRLSHILGGWLLSLGQEYATVFCFKKR